MAKVIRDYYKMLIISQPGKGKTHSFINLDRNTTGFINVDDKPLPFDDSFKYYAKPRKWAGVIKAFEDYCNNEEIKVIVIDTITFALDLLLDEMRTNFKGFDVWTNYNIHLSKFLKQIRAAEKEVFITGHYEVLNIEGDPEKRLKVHGKEHEGRVEGHFTIVFFADVKFKNDKPEYYFKTAGEGLSARCPTKIFNGALTLPNDCKMILDKVVEFAKKSGRELENTEKIIS